MIFSKRYVSYILFVFLHYIMKKIHIYIMAALTMAADFVSCRHSSVNGQSDVVGDTVRMKYAEHISIVKYDGYTLVSLSNPWKTGAVLHRYVLVDRKDSAEARNLPKGTVVYTPVNRAIVFTSPHCYLLGEIGASRAVKGVCDLAYINIPQVQQAAKSGSIADCGNSMSPSVERIVSTKPQAIFVSPFEGASYGQIDRLGVPVIECADYMETSALGRAEWMRFYGMLVGKGHESDSLFDVVDRKYAEYRSLAKMSAVHPRVITERVVSGVWYCPGGRSSMGRLISDAGGRYAFADDSHSGSLTLSPEKVIAKASDADMWFFVGSGAGLMSRGQLLSEYSGYKMIKAFRTGNVYECLPSMNNQYFEKISFRPDFLLLDFVKIMHPDLKINKNQLFYEKSY